MIPVTQTETGADNPRANCLMSCVASILEVPLESLPCIYEMEQQGKAWFDALREALRPLGYTSVHYDQTSEQYPPIAPLGYHIAVGRSPRSEAMMHAVVAFNGIVVHDPHPTRAGLGMKPTHWILLVPVAA